MMANNTCITYIPLTDATSQIRTLLLHRGNSDDPLVATLQHRSLEESQGIFDAISYCWGREPDDPHFSITLQQENDAANSRANPVMITENLYNALKRFRSTTEELCLWNDAVCINQKDEKEKGQQVRLMGKIYTDARKVLIYLGEPDESTPGALDLMDQIYNAVVNTPEDDVRRPLRWILDNNLPTVMEPLKWEPLKTFFRRDWFRRKWIIQECVLAQQPIFHLGGWQRGWDYMVVINDAINTKGLAVLDHTTYDDPDIGIALQHGLTQFRNIANVRKALDNGTKYQLMDLAALFQDSRASDLRDHLFALLDLARDSDHPDLAPCYGESDTVLKVCVDYARYFLRERGNLEVLYRAGMQGQKLLAPSWVPDWYGGHDKPGYDRNSGLWNPLNRPVRYNVSPDQRSQLIDDTERDVLGLKGIIIDTITILANKRRLTPGTKMDKDQMISQKQSHLEEVDEIMSTVKTYPTGEAIADVQWRTLTCNVGIDLRPAMDDQRIAYEAWRRFLGADNVAALPEDRITQQPFRMVMDDFNEDKVFGLTSSGHVGMFPQCSRVGDKVAVLHGGEFPFVLRQCNLDDSARFELVGQSYIHGRMEEGQLDLDAPGFKTQDIFLGTSFKVDVEVAGEDEVANGGMVNVGESQVPISQHPDAAEGVPAPAQPNRDPSTDQSQRSKSGRIRSMLSRSSRTSSSFAPTTSPADHATGNVTGKPPQSREDDISGSKGSTHILKSVLRRVRRWSHMSLKSSFRTGIHG